MRFARHIDRSLGALLFPPPSTYPSLNDTHDSNYRLQDWENSYYACGGIVYLIDLSDRARFAESKIVLDGILATEHLQQTPIVILGNKADVHGCAREDEIRQIFNMQVRAQPYHTPSPPPHHSGYPNSALIAHPTYPDETHERDLSIHILAFSLLFFVVQPTGRKTVPIAKDSGIRPLEYFTCSIKNGIGFGDALNWLTYYVDSKPPE
jgi:hypothetical protein